MLINTRKFFKDNKIVRACRMSAICSLNIFISAYLHQIALEIMLLVDKLYEIRITENENRRNFGNVRYL